MQPAVSKGEEPSGTPERVAADAAAGTVLVIGGAGFIGTHLVRELTARGHDVCVADRQLPPLPVPGARYVPCDVREPITIGNCRPTTVFNLAAVHRTPGHPPSEYYETNVTGAVNVVDFARRSEVERLVFVSSIAVYGAGEEARNEQSDPKPDSDYGRSKLIAEQIHLDWQRNRPGTKLDIVRPAAIFGAGERGNFTRLARALRGGRFVYPGRTDTVKACGYVDDLVSALLFMHQLPESTLYNFCYPRDYTIEDVCTAFHDVAGYALPRSLPPGVVAGVRLAQDAATRLPGSPETLKRVTKLLASTKIRPDVLSKAGYGWTTDLESALRRWRQATPDGTFS